MATPCSAPFLGTAIGFALSRGAAEIFAVFTAVAGGLALPYLIVAAFPAMASRLPKPGPWMSVLRRALGLALAGTAAWLVWVLAGGIGEAGASVVGGIAAGLAILLLVGRWAPRRFRALGAASLAALALAAFLVPTNPPADNRQIDGGAWRPLVPERIPALVADGRTVFVNVTADWCLTCKVNERLVLSRDPVRRRLAEDAVVAMGRLDGAGRPYRPLSRRLRAVRHPIRCRLRPGAAAGGGIARAPQRRSRRGRIGAGERRARRPLNSGPSISLQLFDDGLMCLAARHVAG